MIKQSISTILCDPYDLVDAEEYFKYFIVNLGNGFLLKLKLPVSIQKQMVTVFY